MKAAVAVAGKPKNVARLGALQQWRCCNSECPSTQYGRARVILAANLAAGSIAEQRCPRCGWVTTIIVGEQVEYRVRPG